MLKITKQMLKDNKTTIVRFSFLSIAVVVSLIIIVMFSIKSNNTTVKDKVNNDYSGPTQFLPGE